MYGRQLEQARGAARRANVAEGAAVSASLLCLAHCLALPLILVLLPGVIGPFIESEAFHYLALALVMPSAFAAFRLGYLCHHALAPALLGVAGIGCLAGALVPGAGENAATSLTATGSLLLVAGHTLNWRLRRHAS